MPRRRALTKAQLENRLALPVTEADLVRHWTLGDDDLAIVGRRRRNHNQLGFALQLCALRYPGRLLRPGEIIPQPALHFVADQLGTPLRYSSPTPPGSRPATSNSVSCAPPLASPT